MKKSFENLLFLILSCIIALIINYYLTSKIVFNLVSINNSIIKPYSIILIIFQIVCIFCIIQFVIYETIDEITLKVFYICYFLMLIPSLFGRNIFKIRIYNLNPIVLWNELKTFEGVITAILNIILFMPIGYIFKNKKFGTLIAIMLPVEFMIESTQLIFKVGVFDVDDIILNIIGISLGYLLTQKVISESSDDKNDIYR